MIAKASLRYARITPRKFRQIIPLIKGERAEYAMAVLASVKKRASGYAIDLLKSAIANAKRIQHDVVTSDLYISNMVASGGPMLKRYRAASMGRAAMIKKRTCHITLELDVIKKPVAETVNLKGKEHRIRTRVKEHGQKGYKPKRSKAIELPKPEDQKK